MIIEIRSASFPLSEALHEHVTRKLEAVRRRFEALLDRVVVRLVDLNGPKGGIDKRCRILARLAPMQVLVVEATDADAYVAVSQAALRLDERLARANVRRTRTRKIRRPLLLAASTGAEGVEEAEAPGATAGRRVRQ